MFTVIVALGAFVAGIAMSETLHAKELELMAAAKDEINRLKAELVKATEKISVKGL